MAGMHVYMYTLVHVQHVHLAHVEFNNVSFCPGPFLKCLDQYCRWLRDSWVASEINSLTLYFHLAGGVHPAKSHDTHLSCYLLLRPLKMEMAEILRIRCT